MQIQDNLTELYKINKVVAETINNIIENGGEATEEENLILDLSKEEVQPILESILKSKTFIEGQLLAMTEEITRLNTLKKERELTVEKLEKIVLGNLIKYGNKSSKNVYNMEFDLYKISTRKSEIVEISDVEKIEDELVNLEVKVKINKSQVSKVVNLLKVDYEPIIGEFKPDKKAISEAIKSDDKKVESDVDILGNTVKGAKIVKKLNLTIK
jgi:hypothetical protein